jgi:ribosomal subunit interface protein
VDIVVKGRHTEVPERFRRHVAEKLAKIEKLAPRVIRVAVEVSKEHNPRLADQSERIELTVVSKGPVVRAEACADDPYAALDVAFNRLEARLRKAADRRRIHHGNHTPISVAAATAQASANGAVPGLSAITPSEEAEGGSEEGPLVIREKVHEATPMNLDQALYEMELVGHDFYLYVDGPSGRPSVVYRRKGYDYGVIHLAV